MGSLVRGQKRLAAQLTHTSSSSSSSPPSSKFKYDHYDVFLSFRGEDTKNFTDHLYAALMQKGILTFRDDEELVRGESSLLNLKAIEESRYVIVVLSPNYADSAWCLDEVAKVVDCRKDMGTKVLPVFYHLDPSEVRNQIGDHFGKAFEKHQKRYEAEPNKVQRWKEALYQVGNLAGWHLQDGYESTVIQDIVGMVFTQLNKTICASEELVGMDSHLNELFSYLDIGCLDDVRIIGIWGMGGIGKTTIAQVVFERLRAQFEGDSFLENVKQETEKQGSTVHLQEKLLLDLLNSNVNVQNTDMGRDMIKHRLRSKRVLIVLDDVHQDIQLETLCDRTWFGPGSRIIITSRDEQLISAFGADKVYELKTLADHEAFDLFRLKAFNEDEIGENFLKLSYEFLKYANGLPLAIKVLGSSVRGRNEKFWSSALKRLETNPPKGLIDVLKVGYDGFVAPSTELITPLDCSLFLPGIGLEVSSVVFDLLSSPEKPRYALAGMLCANVAVVLSILELIYEGITQRELLASQNTVQSIIMMLPEITGFGLATIQSISSVVQFYYYSRHEHNHLNVYLAGVYVCFCLFLFKFGRKSDSSSHKKHAFSQP